MVTTRGHIAYGFFTDGNWQEDWAAPGTRYAKNVLYHSKSLLWKVGKEQKFPLTYEGGVQFSSLFGGTVYNIKDRPGVDYEAPTDLKAFWDIFAFSSGDKRYTIGDQLAVAGNHVGSYHMSLKWEMNVIFYNEDGTVAGISEIDPKKGVYGAHIEKGQWHTLEVLESGTVLFEVKDGPYKPFQPEDMMTL